MNAYGGMLVHPCGAKTKLIKHGPFFNVEVELNKGLDAVSPQSVAEATEEDMSQQPVKVDNKGGRDGERCGNRRSQRVKRARWFGVSGAVRSLPQPTAPDAAAKDKRALSGHVPHASWRETCVRGRAKDSPRRTATLVPDTRPAIQMD